MNPSRSLYLKHYFNPDMTLLHPRRDHNNKTDLYNLGFVQNVHENQVLAEFVPLDKVKDPDPRFIYKNPALPAGPNTYIDPQNPNKLLAKETGYVLYNAERIMVKTILNLNSDVSFRTGNIIYIRDVSIEGSVRSGFSVYGENVTINGMVEGGIIHAKNDLTIKGGAKSGASRSCVLKAGKTVRLSFAEKIEVRTRGNVLVTKYSLHSNFYAGTNAIIQEHLMGGNVHALKSVYVGQRLGNRANVPTRIYLGYEPLLIRKLEKVEQRINILDEKMRHLQVVAGHLPPETNETTKKLALMRKKSKAYINSRNKIWETVQERQEVLQNCRVVAAGEVFAGVEIAIGRAYLYVDKPLNCVEFSLRDDEIIISPYIPPKAK